MLNVPNPQRNSNLWLIEKKSYDKPRQHIKKQRHYCANKGPSCQSYGFSNSHEWTWELDYKESWALKNWCFWTVVLEKTLESLLDCKEIQPVHPKGNQCWVFIGRTSVEAETPILWPSDAKSWLIWKDPDAGKDWGQEKGTTEDDITDSMRMGLGRLWQLVMDREARRAAIQGIAKSRLRLSNWTDWNEAFDYVDHCVDHRSKIFENSSRDGNTRPPYLPPEKSVCRSRSNS